jgi:hypothetical protein
MPKLDPLDFEHEKEHQGRPEFEKDEDGNPYWGNVWGWKFSKIGLIMLLVLGMLFTYRQCNYPDQDIFEDPNSLFKYDKD